MVTSPAWLTSRPVRAAIAAALVLVVAGVAPESVVLGAARLAGLVTMGLGAWLIVGRVGAIDLAVAATAGTGALVAGVLAGEAGVRAVAVLPLAILCGAGVGAVSGGLSGHLGRRAGALATLALGAGLIAGGRAVPILGGRSGYHAVPLLAGGDRTDLALMGIVVALAWLAVAAVAGSRAAARAAVAIAAPQVAEAAGRRPWLDAALVGGCAGGALGVGGLLAAAASGSVNADGFGAELATALVLAAVLADSLASRGRSLPINAATWAILATLAIHLPGTVWPLAPLLGTAPVLVVMGPIGLALVVLVGRGGHRSPDGEAPRDLVEELLGAPVADGPATPSGIAATGLAIPSGMVEIAVAPGEVVALVGPNGSGKSTVLARLGGQLDDGNQTALAGEPAPRGARRRGLAGIARGWQRPPDVGWRDLLQASPTGAPALPAGSGAVPGSDERARAAAVLVGLAARRPTVVLLDEPAALLPAAAVASWLRRLAAGGAAVLVVEHRPEVVAAADRIVEIRPPGPDVPAAERQHHMEAP